MTTAMIQPWDGWVALVRPGFEAEGAGELRAWAGIPALGAPRSGVVTAESEADPGEGPGPWTLVFPRQVFRGVARFTGGWPDADAVAEGARTFLPRGRGRGSWVVESPDSDEGRRRWPRCERLSEALAVTGVSPPAGVRAHLVLMDGGDAVLGVSDSRTSSAWPGGIPRLRVPSAAPSRSAWKLEEAFTTLWTDDERSRLLRPGGRAVDLGAAPGGWTWQLARRGLMVWAVDNARLAPVVTATGLVDPVRADGFTWRPPKPVDGLVCDMVKPPQRVARLIGIWAGRGLCRWSVFNWKLPAGDRLRELVRSRRVLERELERADCVYELRLRHLYHDRDEVTGTLFVKGGKKTGSGRRGRADEAVRSSSSPKRRRPRPGRGSGGSRRTGRG